MTEAQTALEKVHPALHSYLFIQLPGVWLPEIRRGGRFKTVALRDASALRVGWICHSPPMAIWWVKWQANMGKIYG